MTAILYSHFTSYSYTFSPLFMSSYDLLWLYNGFISLVINHPYTVIALGVIKLVADSIYLKLLLLLLGLLVFSKEERGLPFFYLSAVVLTIVALVDLDMETELLYQGDSLQVIDEAAYVGLISTDSHEYIPWHNTQALANGIEGLNLIYRSLEFNSSLKSFVDENCSHLLKPLEGHTGIPVQYANTNHLINMSDVVSLKDRYSPELFKDLKGSVGVYVFFKEREEVVTQCGSSINLSNRMYNHYRRAIKGEFIFENHPVSDYKWIPVAYNKDYVELYSSMYSMSVEEEQILTFFTQQEIRSVEQAYSTYAKPTNYKGIPINTWHNNWHPEIVTNQSKNVTWITKDGHSYNRSSITAAARELGFSHQYIRDVAKVEGKTLMTVKYGEVVVTVDSIIKGSKLDLRGNTPLNNFVDQNELQPGYYYLYDSDMNQLPLGPYATARELNTAMGKDTKPNTLSRWVNYLHLVETVSLGLSVYIVKRFTDFKVPVIAHCLTNNTVLELDSLNDAAKLVGATNSSALLTFMLKEKPYKASNGNMYVLKYKDKADYDKALMQLEKRLEATRKWKAAKKS